MSIPSSVHTLRNILLTTLCFLGAYLLASALDLWTTALALSHSTAREGNTFATDSSIYNASRAWLFTLIAGVPLVALFCFGVVNAERISGRWLDRPWRSFLSWRSNPLFSIPWSRHVLDRSPLHAICFAVGFVVLRLLAAANNTMIAIFGAGPLGDAVAAVGHATTPMIGFVVTIGSLYIVLVLGAATVVAKRIKISRELERHPAIASVSPEV